MDTLLPWTCEGHRNLHAGPWGWAGTTCSLHWQPLDGGKYSKHWWSDKLNSRRTTITKRKVGMCCKTGAFSSIRKPIWNPSLCWWHFNLLNRRLFPEGLQVRRSNSESIQSPRKKRRSALGSSNSAAGWKPEGQDAGCQGPQAEGKTFSLQAHRGHHGSLPGAGEGQSHWTWILNPRFTG